MADDNTVYIGNKPATNYVLAVLTQFNTGAKEVTLKARGRTISRCVDVAEISKSKFDNKAKVVNIEIGTEEVESKDGRKLNVSTMAIVLTK